MPKPLSPFIAGALAGGVATICMSALMLASKKMGVQGEHPPKRIAEAALKSAGGEEKPSQKEIVTLAAASHLAFGMVTGGAFALAKQKLHLKKWPLLQGIGFGLLVWGVSYKGWVPALDIMPSAEQDRSGRVNTMVAAHVIYGAVLGKILRRYPANGFQPR